MNDDSATCTLTISTYNRPDALAAVLESVKRQTHIPDEVIVADDGSGDATREVIAAARKTFPCPLIHVWHEDRGFRKCEIWNKTLAQAKGDYIIQIDGDCLLSEKFVEDHLRFSRQGFFSCGSRTLLTPELTQKIIAGTTKRISAMTNGVQNKFNALRILPLTRFFRDRYRAGTPYISKGCNFAFWRKDALAVNGYNEDICGWGREDAEFEVRLMKFGIKRQSLKFAAVQFHLFHKENDRSSDKRNIEILNAALASSEFRTANGIIK